MNQSISLFRLFAILGLASAACGTPAGASAPESGGPTDASVATAALTDTASPPPTAHATLAVQTPAATSRGPDLQASDPAAARLDAGTLQLLEFFRFT